MQLHRVQQVEGPGHYDVAVVGDEVMLTECGNKGVIMVYNRELKFMRQIECGTHEPLSGLYLDTHQNLYSAVRTSLQPKRQRNFQTTSFPN